MSSAASNGVPQGAPLPKVEPLKEIEVAEVNWSQIVLDVFSELGTVYRSSKNQHGTVKLRCLCFQTLQMGKVYFIGLASLQGGSTLAGLCILAMTPSTVDSDVSRQAESC
jgi:hypothetical protein